VNSSTYPIVYSKQTTKSEIVTLIQSKFSRIDRIGLAFEAISPSYVFLDNQPLFIPNENGTFSENVQFIIQIIQLLNVKNIDYLSCDTLNFPNWKEYYNIIQNNTNVIVGASNNKTGNIQYGGDWIMESTGTDIELLYFTRNIEYYRYLLGFNFFTLVLKSNGLIYGCGANEYGQLGNNSTTGGSTLVQMLNTTGKKPVTISCGEKYTIVLMSDGSIYGCGDNNYGQLGYAQPGQYNEYGHFFLDPQTRLIQMPNITGKTPVAVSCSNSFTIVLMSDGSIYGCGLNDNGQLGYAQTGQYDAYGFFIATPQTSLIQMPNTTGKTPVAVSCGSSFTIVLMSDGSIYGCGANYNGQLGTNNYNKSTTLVTIPNNTGKTPVSISCGYSFTIVLMSDGSIYGCGANVFGQLGCDDTYDKFYLFQMINTTGKTPSAISCGGNSTMVLMTDGSIYGCGANFDGQLGNGNTGTNKTLIEMNNTTGKTPVAINAGGNSTIVLMSDGTVYGSGYNYTGLLGNPISSVGGQVKNLVNMLGANNIIYINNALYNYLTISSSSESIVSGNSITGYSISTNAINPIYSITPSISNTGLSFDSLTGLLSGKSNSIGTTAYIIKNNNTTPNKSVTYTLTVIEPPPYLSISSSNESVQFYSPITGYTLSTNIANPIYSISPSVVGTGLTFNTSTGLLSGSFINNTNVINTSITYTITNTNTTPNKSVTYTISITRPDKPVLCIQFV
jgi:alpha-tubulin suppressor-like RCC1 family protein